jgi:hypothetical protein
VIERYFVKGARFRWAPPSAITTQPMDGSLVVTPPTPPGSMTYVGMDGEIVDFGLPNVTTLGFKMNMVITYDWLCYVHGRTAKIASSSDVLTGFMSGCLIATWSDTGGRWVGHIGTIESKGKNEPPNSTVKIGFSTTMPTNVRGYNPATAFGPEEIMPILAKCTGKPEVRIVSLVTPTSEFYSVLFVRRNDLNLNEMDIWVCAGKKLIAGMGHQGLANELVATRPRR